MAAFTVVDFNAYVRIRCQGLLEEIDNWLSKRKRPDPKRGDKVIQTGVGIFHFISDEEVGSKDLRDLLADRSKE